MIEVGEVLSERKYSSGYLIRTEIWDPHGHTGGPIKMKACYTHEGHYIGPPPEGYRLCVARGIKPELRTDESSVCSIGFCEREQKWYGWSHRAMFGFGVGDVVEEGDCAAASLPVGFTAKSLGDARLMAVAFAESVS